MSLLVKFLDFWMWPCKFPDEHWWQRMIMLIVFAVWFILTIRLAIVIMAVLTIIDLLMGNI